MSRDISHELHYCTSSPWCCTALLDIGLKDAWLMWWYILHGCIGWRCDERHIPTNMITLILVMGILDSTRVFRLSRAVAVDIAVLDFVEAAKLRGEKTLWIIFREILPNALTPLFAEFGLRFAFAVLFLSTLSFLGLGIQPPEADWGSIVKENKDGIVFGIPAALIPAAAIAILTISINLVVDSILSRTTSLKGGRG